MLRAGLNKKGPAVFRARNQFLVQTFIVNRNLSSTTRLEMYIVPKRKKK